MSRMMIKIAVWSLSVRVVNGAENARQRWLQWRDFVNSNYESWFDLVEFEAGGEAGLNWKTAHIWGPTTYIEEKVT